MTLLIALMIALSVMLATPTWNVTTAGGKKGKKPKPIVADGDDPPDDDLVEKSWFTVKKAYDGDGVKLKKDDIVELELTDKVKSLVDLEFIEEMDQEEVEQKQRAKSLRMTRDALLGLVNEAVASYMEEAAANDDGGSETTPSSRRSKGIRIPEALRAEVGQDRELLDPLLGYKSVGHFFSDLRQNGINAKGGGVQTKAMSNYIGRLDKINKAIFDGQLEAIGEEGGVLIPAQASTSIYQQVFENNPLLGMVDKYSIRGNSMTFPRFKEETRKSLADGALATQAPRNGGVVSAWVGDGQPLDVTRLSKLGEMQLRLKKLAAMTKVTSEMVEDGGGVMEQWLTRKVADEIAFQVGLAIWEGDGSGKPLGIFNAANPGQRSVNRTTANKIIGADIFAILGNVLASSWTRGLWFINQFSIATALPLLFAPVTNVAGTENVGGWPLWTRPGEIKDTPFGTLLGRPVQSIEFAAAHGTSGDVNYVDASQYCVISKGTGGDVPAINTAMSIHVFFDQDATAFRSTYRIDGQPWMDYTILPFRGGAGEAYSPFVKLN